jgi:2-iminobutanoate/2-iminopropanoate deaminase
MKDIVLTEKGPKPIGPYSQAVKSNGFLFASGQVALDPRNNEFLGGDIRQQTERAMENIKAVVEAAGSNLHHVVKTTVFLKDMNDFAAMNAIYAEYLAPQGVIAPARTTIEAARLPKDALVEIELIAEVGD